MSDQDVVKLLSDRIVEVLASLAIKALADDFRNQELYDVAMLLGGEHVLRLSKQEQEQEWVSDLIQITQLEFDMVVKRFEEQIAVDIVEFCEAGYGPDGYIIFKVKIRDAVGEERYDTFHHLPSGKIIWAILKEFEMSEQERTVRMILAQTCSTTAEGYLLRAIAINPAMSVDELVKLFLLHMPEVKIDLDEVRVNG